MQSLPIRPQVCSHNGRHLLFVYTCRPCKSSTDSFTCKAPNGESNSGQQRHCNSGSGHDPVLRYCQRHCVVHFHLVRNVTAKIDMIWLTWTQSTHFRVVSAYVWQTLHHASRKDPAPRKPRHICHGGIILRACAKFACLRLGTGHHWLRYCRRRRGGVCVSNESI